MSRRVMIVFLCALLAGASASYLVFRWVASQARRATQPSMAEVVVAARNIEVGMVIAPLDLKLAKWAAPLPKGAASKPEQVLGRGVIATIYQGEPVLSSRLAVPGSGGGLAAIIPPGMRACAVRVNEVVGVAGFVTPGMRVDVLMAGIPPGAAPGEGPQVRTLLQNIEVLSAGANIQKDSEGKPQQVQVVNLLVTPEQAERLSLASNQTHIQLILRNPTDTQTANPKGSAMSELFGTRQVAASPAVAPATAAGGAPATAVPKAGRPKAAPPPTPPSGSPKGEEAAALRFRTVEVLNGSARTEAKFNLQEGRK